MAHRFVADLPKGRDPLNLESLWGHVFEERTPHRPLPAGGVFRRHPICA